METVHLDIHGHAMDMLIDAPGGAGPHPAVLLMFHRGGFDDFTKGRLTALREGGYLACAPNFYHRCPDGHEGGDCKQFLKDSEIIAETRAAAGYLRARPDVAGERLFILGHCMGGRMALMGAARVEAGFRGCVVFYGGGMFLPWGDEGEAPIEWIGDIPCPVIGFFGDHDVNPSPEDVDKIDAKLTQGGVRHAFHRYPDVGHGFTRPMTPRKPGPRPRMHGQKPLIFLANNLAVPSRLGVGPCPASPKKITEWPHRGRGQWG